MPYSADVTSPQPADQPALRVGYVPGVTLTKWRTRWRQRLPRVRLEVVAVPQSEQRRVLDSSDADLCFARLPLDADGLHLIPLYEEVQVAWMSKDHPLATVESLTLADLAGDVVLTDPTPEALEQAAFADAVLRVPMGVARSGSRRDLVYRPITDDPPTRICLAWRTENPNPWITEFIGIVRGRTENSSRTAQARAASPTAKPKQPGRPPQRLRGRRR